MLSGDNLFVFLLLLQQVGLHPKQHVVAISHGMLGALLMRILLSLAGAALLQRFAWLILLFAAVLLIVGFKMLCESAAGVVAPSEPSRGDDDADDTEADFGGKDDGLGLAGRCIGRCVPLLWSDETGAQYLEHDSTGRLCATRMAVVVLSICLADVVFAMHLDSRCLSSSPSQPLTF